YVGGNTGAVISIWGGGFYDMLPGFFIPRPPGPSGTPRPGVIRPPYVPPESMAPPPPIEVTPPTIEFRPGNPGPPAGPPVVTPPRPMPPKPTPPPAVVHGDWVHDPVSGTDVRPGVYDSGTGTLHVGDGDGGHMPT